MDNEIVLLQDIKSALWVLIWIVGVGVTATVIRVIATIYPKIKNEMDNAFYNDANALFEHDKYESLIEFCFNELKKNPKEAYAYWFLGKAHFKMKEYDQAEDYFKQAVELVPSWEKDWIAPYTEKIAAERNSGLTKP